MNTTLTIQAVTQAESLVLKKFGHRTFAELDKNGRPCAYFGEVHKSSLDEVPRKPIITRKKSRKAVKASTLLVSVSRSARVSIAKGTQLDRVAAYCHRRLRKGPLSRKVLIEGCIHDLELTERQAGPAISDLLHPTRYNHLKVARNG